jgi:acyl-CoA thioesterase
VLGLLGALTARELGDSMSIVVDWRKSQLKGASQTMPRKFAPGVKGSNPFGDLVGLTFTSAVNGDSRCVLEVDGKHLSPHHTVHGGVAYTMADTGMGAALYSCIDDDEICSTIEIKIAYFKQVSLGTLTCDTKVIHRSKRIATLESDIRHDGQLVAKAIGTWSIYKAKRE